jgi:hypothetical protein
MHPQAKTGDLQMWIAESFEFALIHDLPPNV